jgi:hypothetical protein
LISRPQESTSGSMGESLADVSNPETRGKVRFGRR